MPFDDSLPDVPVWHDSALRCKFVRGSNGKRCVWWYDHPDKRHHDGFQTWTEPAAEGPECEHEWSPWRELSDLFLTEERICQTCGLTERRTGAPETSPGDLDYALTEKAEEALKQPVQRPPYAVAYSVDGKAYEVLLPGDAIAVAEDGMLKIVHDSGQVAGIVRVMPWKESA